MLQFRADYHRQYEVRATDTDQQINYSEHSMQYVSITWAKCYNLQVNQELGVQIAPGPNPYLIHPDFVLLCQ